MQVDGKRRVTKVRASGEAETDIGPAKWSRTAVPWNTSLPFGLFAVVQYRHLSLDFLEARLTYCLRFYHEPRGCRRLVKASVLALLPAMDRRQTRRSQPGSTSFRRSQQIRIEWKGAQVLTTALRVGRQR